MKSDPAKFIDRLVWCMLGSSAAAIGKLIFQLADATHAHEVELSRLSQQLQYHEREMKILSERESVIFRIENEIGSHEKRLNALENKIWGQK